MPVLDDFNRANEGPPPSANWTTPAWTNGLKVLSLECVPSSAVNGDDNTGYWSAATFGPDSFVEVEVSQVATWDANYIDFYLRVDSDDFNAYYFCDVTLAGGLYVANISSSTDGFIGGDTGAVASSVGDVLQFKVIGNDLTLSAKYNGDVSFTVIKSVTVPTPLAATAGYIATSLRSSTDGLPFHLGSFDGGTISGPTGITADLDVTLDDMTLEADAVLERLAALDVTLDDMTLSAEAFVRSYVPPILMNTRISAINGIGVEVSAGSALIAHVHEITAATSIKVSGGATAKIIGNQFDPTIVSVTGTLEYLQGDRSAWDMANYAARHASDINGATFAYHRNPAISGTYTVSNPVTLRTIDLSSFTLNELAAIVGTLLADLGMT